MSRKMAKLIAPLMVIDNKEENTMRLPITALSPSHIL